MTQSIHAEPGAKPGVSVIIPAYNEAAGICRVLHALQPIALIQEILVVDDGSRDRTAELAEACIVEDGRIRVLRHPKNLGKGQAFITGYKASVCPYIISLDADLSGLQPAHIEGLLGPVLRGEIDMNVGVFRAGGITSDLGHHLTPWLSGQRCLRASVLPQVAWEAASGYGLETAFTVAAIRHNWRRVYTPLHGVSHPHSEFHRGLLRGLATRARMYAHILRAWYLAWKDKVQVGLNQLPFNTFL